MSELVLPPGIALPPRLQQRAEPEEGATDEQKADALPVPAGYKLLCIVPDVANKFENSDILMPEASRVREEHGTTVLFVLRMGPEAYKDTAKFPNGPWCKEGDFIIVRTYSGTRLKIYGKEFRVVNDDMVEATVASPMGITRA